MNTKVTANDICCVVREISIPTPWRVITNSEGVGGSKAKLYAWGGGEGGGGGGLKQKKNVCEMGMDIHCGTTHFAM